MSVTRGEELRMGEGQEGSGDSSGVCTSSESLCRRPEEEMLL